MGQVVKLVNVRLAFPKLWEAKPVGDGDSKYYGAAFPIEPKSANHTAIEAAITAAAKEQWGPKADAILKKLREEKKVCYQHKALTDGEGNVYPGFEGAYSLNASRNETKGPVVVVDKDKTKLTAASGRPYAGCYVDSSVEFWAQDNKNGKRINATLRWVQFRNDGDAFASGAPVSDDEIDDLSVGEEEDSLT